MGPNHFLILVVRKEGKGSSKCCELLNSIHFYSAFIQSVVQCVTLTHSYNDRQLTSLTTYYTYITLLDLVPLFPPFSTSIS